MSGSVIGALRVNLGLDSAKFEKGAKRAKNPLDQMKRQFMAFAAVASAAGAAISAFALKAGQDIDAAAKSARRIGASVAGYRALEMAADDAGVTLSSLANDVQTMNREIAKNSKGAQEALRSLGITVEELGTLDADQKIALIADRVKALGLDSGQTSALLQRLGVRNREMALLVMGGGEALRQARIDVQEFGLAISDIDAARIEAANDEIAGLADITAYLGDRVALMVVPALGNMAKALTDSLREGGLLRQVIDTVLAGFERLGAYVSVIAAGLGVRYVAALAMATASTITLSGALAFLRVALIRTGIGALIVGAGELVYQFSKLVTAAGGFGNALELLGNVAKEVWERIKLGGESLGRMIQSVAEGIQASFLTAFAWIVRKFADMTQTIATGINNLFSGIGLDLNLTGMGQEAADAIEMVAAEASRAAENQAAAARVFASEAAAPLKSIAALREAMAGVADQTNEAATAADGYTEALEESAAAAGGARDKTKELTDAQRELESAADSVESSFESAFTGFITGVTSARKAASQLLASLAQMAASAAFKAMFGGSKGFDLLGSIFGSVGGKRAAGGPTRAGVPYLVNENTARSEIFVPSTSGAVLNVSQAQAALQGASSSPTQVHLIARSDPGVILEIAQNAAVQVTRQGLKEFSGEPLTNLLRANSVDQRMVRT
jgi:hypothetical protein